MNERATLWEIWRETRSLIRPVRGRYLGAAAAVIVSGLITLAGPALVRSPRCRGLLKPPPRTRAGPSGPAATRTLRLAAAKALVVRAQTLLAASAGERFLGSLRMAAFD